MIDWNSVANEAAELLSGYLRIKSVNPPGDEGAAAAYLAEVLEQRGFKAQLYESSPNRSNLICRLAGNGSKRPILLYHHMDVVDADASDWTHGPFSGDIEGGYVYGRGAIDMKGMGIMQILALDLLRRFHPERTRDLILFGAADEEKGGHFGARWMLERHGPIVDAEYVWDEGGFGLDDFFGPRPVFATAVAEKQDLWLRLSARGSPGHSGIPKGDNAAETLIRALGQVMTLNSRWVLHPIVRSMFAAVSRVMPFPKSLLASNLSNPLVFRLARPSLASDPTLAAMLRDTLSVTVLSAGGKENIIPDKAEAVLDVRLLPGRDPDDFKARLVRLIEDDRESDRLEHPPLPTTPTGTDTEFYRALTTTLARLVPGSVTAPMLTPGTTDSCHFRRNGAACYGLFPAVIDPGELARFHGIDERISIENLGLGTRIFYETLAELMQ